jgi:GT2 family glycosyltransferase
METPRTTIGFVPREVFCTTKRALETLFERTDEPFELICIDGGSPPEVQKYLEEKSQEKNFTLLRTDHYLTPNQARNLVIKHTKTPYVVFVDNDVLVGEGWLTPLVDCAEETGAWVVGPLYFEHSPEQHRLHMVGGDSRIQTDTDGTRYHCELHHHGHKLWSEVQEPIERHETELIEFHTVLVAMEAFQRIGPLDEGLLCFSEHCDLCLMVREAGGQVLLEPESKITYIPPKRLSEVDRAFFELRWSEAWATASIRRFAEKWSLTPGNFADVASLKWVRYHRSYGLPWLYPIRRMLGRKWANSLFKRGLLWLDVIHNRRRYPPEQFGQVSPAQPHLVHAPAEVADQAA